ncbi:hypothetical protein, variant [Aphanomyces invadans]|uniref:UBA domain-containing protein n=1 Tax=Aphanomyces invadans TaxID=157072 RepID=A0A024UK97_9STRA|nr:hypothetical protein, variant [Aphanomyces invadans]ETW06282.1 hypothetical protein, variant [Aphanomyces invadans]|eukprot:XP_008864357.1 hypothetical protein, variant [Aphanomyces invadans]
MSAPEMTEAVSFGDDFGQKIDLTVRIREILRNYPEGTSVLKEMVQNADDAGATEISFCLDKRTHASDNLAYTKLAVFQGPSLLVHNNAEFTDVDFESIQRIGDSLKKDSSKGWKTGRFGIGFNSVYHLTDFPTFVSGRRIVMFDPQATHLPNVNPSNPGKLIDFLARQDLLAQFPNQFAPFKGFGCNLAAHFHGTMFRLPLRTANEARRSKLSASIRTCEDIQHLLDEFFVESTMVLLFLRHLAKISIYEWTDGQDAPSMRYTTAAAAVVESLACRSQIVARPPFSQAGTSWDVHLKVTTRDIAHNMDHHASWLVCNQLGGGTCSMIANHPDNASLRLIPYGGVAARLDAAVPGRAFCFLPLPVETGLPVHINGYFELSSNRRDIWTGDGLSGDGLLRAQWNDALLKDVIAPCYARAIATIRHESPYLFPSHVPAIAWQKALVLSMLRLIQTQPCLFARATNSFVSPAEAKVLPVDMPHRNTVEAVLQHDSVPLLSLDLSLQRLLLDTRTIPAPFAPQDARSWYKAHRTSHGSDPVAMRHLTEFCFDDINSTNSQEIVGVDLVPLLDGSVGTFQDGAGVDADALAQLSAMGFDKTSCVAALTTTHDASEALNWLLSHDATASSSTAAAMTTYYVCGDPLELELLQASCSNVLVNTAVLSKRMVALVTSVRHLNVERVTIDSFRYLVGRHVFPSEWKHQQRVAKWSQDPPLSFAWFQSFWSYVGPSPAKFELFQDEWPVLPTKSAALCALHRQSTVVSGELLPDAVVAILDTIGVDMLAPRLFQNTPHHTIWNFIQQPTPHGVLATLSRAMCQALSMDDKATMRDFLLSDHCHDMDNDAVQHLKSLPIFPGVDGAISITPSTYVAPQVDVELLAQDDPHCMMPNVLSSAATRVLNVHVLDKMTFYWTKLFPAMPAMAIDRQHAAIECVLRDVSLFLQRPLGPFQDLAIFPTMAAGPLKRITELYDPEIDMFVGMIHPSCFPVAPSPDALAAMRLLGLQQMLTRPSICQLIVALASAELPDVHRAKEFVTYIDTHADTLLHPTENVAKPSKKLPFFLKPKKIHTTATHLADEMKEIIALRDSLTSHAWLPVLTTGTDAAQPMRTPVVTLALPRDVRLTDDMWLCSASCYILDGTITSDALRELFGWKRALPPAVLVRQLCAMHQMPSRSPAYSTATCRIYEACGRHPTDMVRPLLADAAWIWIEDTFYTSSQVAVECYIHASPYLAAVPRALDRFASFFKSMGVRQTFQAHDYVSVLQAMYDAKLSGNNVALRQDELALAVQLIQALSDMPRPSTGRPVYMPSANATLQEATTLAFNDAPWVDPPPPHLVFVHSQISNVVAASLGCISFRSCLVLATSEHLQGVESFGQSEPLTRRLASILEQYPEGTSILNELVQNADDAQATQFSICYSRKTFKSSSLLSAPLGLWQGAALYCYNDAVFRDSDFANLARIGQGSKLGNLSTTGRFGLGFNSVYHLTDVPSLVSGESLVMFDPHATNVPNATATHPGIKIRLTNSSLVGHFPDQFAPYALFGCDVASHRFDGTLFRFPLRNADTGARSDIKKGVYTDAQMLEFLDLFKQSLTSTLLFLRHVSRISVYILDEGDDAPTLLYEGSVHERPPHPLNQFPTKAAFYAHLAKQTAVAVQTNRIHVTTSHNSDDMYWITHAVGCGLAQEMALANQALKLIPYAAVAARVGDPLDGRAFSFLPLPVKVGLPVHINGYFELSSNRRDIWHGDDMTGEGKQRSEWNTRLLVDVVVPAYAAMLQTAQLDLPNNDVLALFPAAMPPCPWNLVVAALFRVIRDIPLIRTEPTRDAVPLSNVVVSDSLSPRTTVLERLLRESNIPFAVLPPGLACLVVDLKVVLGSLTSSTFRHLLRTHRIRIDALPRPLVPDVVAICTEDGALSELDGLPLLAMQNQTFRQLVLKRAIAETVFCTTALENELLDGCGYADRRLNMDLCGHVLCAVPGLTDASNVKSYSLGEPSLPLFPKTWHGQELVPWDPTSSHVSASWLRTFWTYVTAYVETNGDGTVLHEWPCKPCMLPDRTLVLVQLQVPTLVVDDSLVGNPFVRSFFTPLGQYILETPLLPHKECPPWLVNHSYCTFLTSTSLIHLLARHPHAIQTASLHEREMLLAIVCQQLYNDYSDGQRTVIHTLELFRVHGGNDRTFVSLESQLPLVLAPIDCNPALLGTSFLRPQGLTERQFCRDAGIPEWTQDQVFLEHVLPCLANYARPMQLNILIDSLASFTHASAAYQDALKAVLVVPTQSSSSPLRRVSELHDPTKPDLAGLLGPTSFPTQDLCTPTLLDVLRQLGLKQHLSVQAMAESAAAIDDMSRRNRSEDAHARACHLLAIVNEHLDSLYNPTTDAPHLTALATLCWLPVAIERAHPLLPWRQTQYVASPDTTWAQDMAWLGSSSKCILLGHVESKTLASAFNWNVTSTVVVAQLKALSEFSTCDTAEAQADMTHHVRDLYVALLTLPVDEWRPSLEEIAWLWTGFTFVKVSQVATGCPPNLEPLLCPVPSASLVPTDLLDAFAIKDAFDSSDYIHALQSLPQTRRLSDREMDVALALLAWIHTTMDNTSIPSIGTDVLLPDADLRLVRAANLTADDMAWNPAQDIRCHRRLVHPNVPVELALRLGATSLHTSIASASSSSVKMGLPPVPVVLANLNHPDAWNLQLFRAVTALADKWHVSHVDFVLDQRHHPREKVCRPTFQSLQEESLLIHFHDHVMSADELYGDIHAIFTGLYVANCVQVLAGDAFYVVDPCGIYVDVPGAICYAVQSTEFQRYSDQLVPFTCLPLAPSNPTSGFSGTVLRCPWRKLPCDSFPACPVINTAALVAQLDAAVKEAAAVSVLFTQYLSRVTLWTLGVGSEYARDCNVDIQLYDDASVLCARRKLVQDSEWKKPPVFQLSSFFRRSVKEELATVVECTVRVETNNVPRVQRWLVSSNVAVGRTREVAKSMHGITPHASVACLLHQSDGGTHVVGQMCTTVPSGTATGLPVHINGGFLLAGLDLPLQGFGASDNQYDTKAMWNRILIEDAVSEAYVQLLLAIKQAASPWLEAAKAVYRAWPSIHDPNDHHHVVGPFTQHAVLSKLSTQPLFLCGDGTMRKLDDGYDPATLHIQVASYCHLHFAMFQLPTHVYATVREHGAAIPQMQPRVLRDFLKRVHVSTIHCALCMPLLEYCASDLTSTTYHELAGLPLLPLADGSVGLIPYGHHIFTDKFVVATMDQQQLLPTLCARFLALHFVHSMAAWLADPKFVAAIGAQHFSVQLLATSLDTQLPKTWKNQTSVRWDHRVVDDLWLVRFWSQVSKADASLFQAWPLLPVSGGRELMSCRYVDRVIWLWQDVSLAVELRALVRQGHDRVREDLTALERESRVLESLTRKQLDVFLEDDAVVDSPTIVAEPDNAAPHTHRSSETCDAILPVPENDPAHRSIVDILSKLHAPSMEVAYFHENVTFPLPTAHVGILGCLAQWPERLEWAGMSAESKAALVYFFASRGSSYGGYNRAQIDQLRRLPMYKTLSGQHVAITDDVVMLSSEISTFPPYLPDHVQGSFLELDPATSSVVVPFYKELRVDALSEAQLFIQFVMPQFQTTQAPAQTHAMLDMIHRKWNVMQDKPELLAFLQRTPLFPCATGGYVCAYNFFDPRLPLLKAMFIESSPEFFPPPHYSSDSWLAILGAIGMPTTISPDILLRCACHVSHFTTPLTRSTEELVIMLHQHLVTLSFVETHAENAFVAKLKAIACVPATVYSPVDGTHLTKLVRYDECAVPDDQFVACFAKPILHSYAVPPRILWRRVGLVSPPVVADVIQHVSAIALHAPNLVETWSFSFAVTDMFLAIFSFLQTHWSDVTPPFRAQLRDMPLVPIGARLVKANRLYIRLADNLAPFLFEVPRVFGGCDALFRDLGTTPAPQADDYIALLHALHDECPVLNLNELDAVIKILGLIEAFPDDSTATLPVPTTTNRLARLHECVFNDAPAMLADIDGSHLHVVHPRVGPAICHHLRVPNLTAAVVEVLAPSFVPDRVHDTTELTARLRSPEFSAGLQQIIQASDFPGPAAGALDLPLWPLFTVVGVRDIPTRYVVASTGQDVTSSDSRPSKLFFVDADRHLMYVRTEPPAVSLVHAVALGVQHALHGLLKDSLPVVALLQTAGGDPTNMLRSLGLRTAPDADATRGQVGCRLVPFDKDRLELKPMRTFTEGEVVAVEANQAYVYAVVCGEKAVEVSGIQQVLVRTSSSTTRWMRSTHVYSFKSERRPRGTAPSSATTPRATRASVAPGAVAAIPPSPDAPPLPPAILDHHVIDAVNGLLARLNLRLSAPYESLVADVMQLQQRVAAAEQSNAAMADRLNDALQVNNDLVDSFVCSICLEHHVDRVLVPCGHIFCHHCTHRIAPRKCPVCRHVFTLASAFHKPT